MSSATISLHSTRRSTAVGIWSFLVVLVALVRLDLSVGVSIGTELAISILNSVALILVCGNHSIDRSTARRQSVVSFLVSNAINLAWAVLLGSKSSASTVAAFAAVGTIPLTVTWLTLMSGKTGSAVNQPSTVASDRFQYESTTTVPTLIDSIGSAIDGNEVVVESDIDESRQPSTIESPLNRDSSNLSDVTQWMTRSLTIDGEVIDGGVRIAFESGQRDATVHVSFCPPFRCIPAVTTEDLDGAGLEIRVAAAFPFGARLSVRRTVNKAERGTKASAEMFRIRFVAIASQIRRAA